MQLNVMEKALLRDILNARIIELKSKPVFYTGRTPREVVVSEQQELWDTLEFKKTILGDAE